MTPAEYTEFLTECDYTAPNDVVRLINDEYTAQKFNEEIFKRKVEDPTNVSMFFSRYFEVDTFPNAIGETIQQTIYLPARIVSKLNRFQYDDETCSGDAGDLTRCMWCYEQIPSGGTMHVESKLFRWAAETPEFCLENIRTRAHFEEYMSMHLDDRYAFETQANSDFYWLTLLRTIGHKTLLQMGGHPLVSTLADSPLPQYPSTFMSDFFPPVTNPDLVLPLQKSILLQLAKNLQYRTDFKDSAVARGKNGEPIWEAFIDSDAYFQLIAQYPDEIEAIKYTMAEKLFKGYNAGVADSAAEREIWWNFAFKVFPNLPRLARNAVTGGLIFVQPTITIEAENGNAVIPNPGFDTAPYGLFLIPSSEQAKVYGGRAPVSIPGVPITLTEGENTWFYFNKYDKVCNPDDNIFKFRYRARRGFMPKRPWKAFAMIYARQDLGLSLDLGCNRYPDVCVTPEAGCVNASLLNPSGTVADRRSVEADITLPYMNADRVQCSGAVCGSNLVWKITVPFTTARAGAVIPTECGDDALFGVRLSNGTATTAVGTLIDNSMAGTQQANAGIYYFEFAAPLASGAYIEWVEALDDSPLEGTILSCFDESNEGCEQFEAGEVQIVISGGPFNPLTLGDEVTVTFDDETTAVGTISAIDHQNLTYNIVFTDDTINCASRGGLVSAEITE